MRYVLSIGAFLVVDAVGAMLLCVTLYKQREKMDEFVETIITADRSDGFVPTEQHAHDFYKMQAEDLEFRQFSRQGLFWNYLENMRVAEFHYLQKWHVELERVKQTESNPKLAAQVEAILKEMRERTRVLGLNDVEVL